jgi:hypothetical protein
MPDRIPELDQFLTQAKEAPMMPAEEVRRRGDRRRVTRRTGIAAGAMALAMIAGFGVWQSPIVQALRDNTAVPLPADPTQSPSDPTQSPTDNPGPVLVAPTYDNLPEGRWLFHQDLTAETREQYEGAGEPKSFCDPGQYGDPSTILTQEYGAVGFPIGVTATVFGYDSVEAASEGYRLLHDAAVNCPDVYEENNHTNTKVQDASEGLQVDTSGLDADTIRTGYVTAVGNPPEDPNTGLWTEMVILQTDERLLYVTQQFMGMDNNCTVAPDDPDSMPCTLAAAVPDMLERLTQ